MEDGGLASILILVVLVILSGFFSASETAFSSINKIRLKNNARDGNKRASKTLDVAERYDSTLSTILIGNNIVNIAAASVGTLIFTDIYGPAGVGISTLVITVVVLIFGEVTPKSLAKENSENFAMFATPAISFLNIVFKPLNKLFELWKKAVAKFVSSGNSPSITEDELKFMIEEIENEGILGEQESDLIQSAIEFDDITVDEILTPRVDVIAVERGCDAEHLRDLFSSYGFSRIPVYEKTIDNIIGIIHEKDFFTEYVEDHNFDINKVVKDAIFAPETLKISKLLKILQKQKSHIAVIVDSYGGTLGIATLEDILEQLVGDIWDEYDEVKTEFVDNADGTYTVAGDINVDDMFDYMDYNAVNLTNRSISVSGWISEMLMKIPEEGDSVNYRDLIFTVSKANDKRAIEVIVKRNEDQDIDE